MIVIRKRFLVGIGFGFFGLLVFSCMISAGNVAALPAFASEYTEPVTVVIDPGHGGEDGGAVSPDGTTESHLNLAVSVRINELLRFAGQPSIMTRATDAAIHTEGDTIRARKASDIRNRVTLVNNTENAVLLSIHQNSLPSSPVTHGAQVFWNSVQNADLLAGAVQDSLNICINIGNEKQTKKISGTIYLMKHVTVPAILVECGFLSNAEECEKLQESTYQQKLAAAIVAGYLYCLTGEDIS